MAWLYLMTMYDDKKIKAIREWVGAGTINIFGRPFSGKDVQGRRLAELLDGNLLGGGDIIRNTNIPDKAKECIKTGKLIPSDDYVNIVLPYFSQSKLVNRPLILSSVGRWHGEEDGVIRAINESGHPLKAVIYLDISNRESHVRWLAREINNDRSDRHDDTEKILEIRFNEFQAKTIPVIEYYRNLGVLIEIDGKGERDKITETLLDKLFEQSKQ